MPSLFLSGSQIVPIQPRARSSIYGVPNCEGVQCFALVLGIVISSLLMTACARSPTNADQQVWVWRQGPGNSGDVENQQSTELQPSIAEEQEQLRAIATKNMKANTEVTNHNDRYTQAVRYDNLLYVSGQIPLDSKSLKIIGETTKEQTQVVMDNIKRILNNNDMTMSNVVFVTLYLKQINDLSIVDGIYQTYFRRALPARTVVAVADLPRGSLLEISVVAGQ